MFSIQATCSILLFNTQCQIIHIHTVAKYSNHSPRSVTSVSTMSPSTSPSCQLTSMHNDSPLTEITEMLIAAPDACALKVNLASPTRQRSPAHALSPSRTGSPSKTPKLVTAHPIIRGLRTYLAICRLQSLTNLINPRILSLVPLSSAVCISRRTCRATVHTVSASIAFRRPELPPARLIRSRRRDVALLPKQWCVDEHRFPMARAAPVPWTKRRMSRAVSDRNPAASRGGIDVAKDTSARACNSPVSVVPWFLQADKTPWRGPAATLRLRRAVL